MSNQNQQDAARATWVVNPVHATAAFMRMIEPFYARPLEPDYGAEVELNGYLARLENEADAVSYARGVEA